MFVLFLIALADSNLLQNGRFLTPTFADMAFIFNDNQVLPWISSTTQLVVANSYNPNAPLSMIALELTPRNNVNVSQALRLPSPISLTLSFTWFAKAKEVLSGRGRVLWNDEEVMSLQAKDQYLHKEYLTVVGVEGLNWVSFEGRGAAASDNGLLIAEVSLS